MLVKLFAKEERHLVVETMKKCIDDWRSLIGQEYQPSTISRYDNCYESLKTVVKEFYKKEDITFYELNGEFIDTFEMHLRTERKLSQNTFTKYMSCFRKVLGIARDNGWLNFDPLVGKRKRLFKKEETCPTFLTLDELQRITEKKFSTERLNHVKDFFLFCCYTGLSYIDVSTLRPIHLYRDNNGKLWIHKSRVKITTNKETCTSNVPLLPPAIAIRATCRCFLLPSPFWRNTRDGTKRIRTRLACPSRRIRSRMENPQRVDPVCQMPLTLRKKSAYAPYESWPTGSFLFWLICFSRL